MRRYSPCVERYVLHFGASSREERIEPLGNA